MITDLENKTFVKDAKITVKDFMHQWLDLYIKGQLSPTTVQHYIDQTENYIIPEHSTAPEYRHSEVDLFFTDSFPIDRKATLA